MAAFHQELAAGELAQCGSLRAASGERRVEAPLTARKP
jgi:hypothetical protein